MKTVNIADGREVVLDIGAVDQTQAEALATAIADILIRGGLIRPDAVLDGPQLLQFAGELGDYLVQTAPKRGHEIANMLVLSTGHLTEDTCNNYMAITSGPWYEKTEHGWFVHVESITGNPEVELEPRVNVPEDLMACATHARSLGCEWIMFDQDGPAEEAIPVYEW